MTDNRDFFRDTAERILADTLSVADIEAVAERKAPQKMFDALVEAGIPKAEIDRHKVKLKVPKRFATGNGDTVVAPCVPGSCPLLSAKSQLPANPFFARLTGAGKCECAEPQVCDA